MDLDKLDATEVKNLSREGDCSSLVIFSEKNEFLTNIIVGKVLFVREDKEANHRLQIAKYRDMKGTAVDMMK